VYVDFEDQEKVSFKRRQLDTVDAASHSPSAPAAGAHAKPASKTGLSLALPPAAAQKPVQKPPDVEAAEQQARDASQIPQDAQLPEVPEIFDTHTYALSDGQINAFRKILYLIQETEAAGPALLQRISGAADGNRRIAIQIAHDDTYYAPEWNSKNLAQLRERAEELKKQRLETNKKAPKALFQEMRQVRDTLKGGQEGQHREALQDRLAGLEEQWREYVRQAGGELDSLGGGRALMGHGLGTLHLRLEQGLARRVGQGMSPIPTPLFISVAHELIHALHDIDGQMGLTVGLSALLDVNQMSAPEYWLEEARTVGLEDPFSLTGAVQGQDNLPDFGLEEQGQPLTENEFRRRRGLPLRETYGVS
jgi:hypothetical protein